MESLNDKNREPLVDSIKSVLRYVKSDKAKTGQGQNKTNGPARKLFDEQESERVLLKIAFKKVPERRHRFNILLPHPFVDIKTISACLIVKDFREGEYDYDAAATEYLQLLRNQGIVVVNRVIPVSQLRAEFKQYKSRRELASQHDIFLADRAVYKFLPLLMGKVFFKLKKFPREVDLSQTGANNKTVIEKALEAAHLVINNRGHDCSVSIGLRSQTPEDLADNILHTVKQVVRHSELAAAEGGSTIQNIRSAHFQTKDIAVPIFFSAARDLTNVSTTSDATSDARKTENVGFATEPQEIDTVLSGKVEILPDGDIRIIPNELDDDGDMEDDEAAISKANKNKKKRTASEAKLPEKNTAAETDVDMLAADALVKPGAKKKNRRKKRKSAPMEGLETNNSDTGIVKFEEQKAAGKKKKNRNKKKQASSGAAVSNSSNGTQKAGNANAQTNQLPTAENKAGTSISPQRQQQQTAAGGLSKSAKKRLKEKNKKHLAASSNNNNSEMPQV